MLSEMSEYVYKNCILKTSIFDNTKARHVLHSLHLHHLDCGVFCCNLK